MFKTNINLNEYYNLMRITEKCSILTTLDVLQKKQDGTILKDNEDKIHLSKKRRILNTL